MNNLLYSSNLNFDIILIFEGALAILILVINLYLADKYLEDLDKTF